MVTISGNGTYNPSSILDEVLGISLHTNAVGMNPFFCLPAMCIYLPIPPHGKDVTHSQFLNGVKQVWIQNFPSPRLVV